MMDENFLMSIATLGAFAIQEYAEAVGVMLFYRIGEMFEHIAVEKSRGQIMSAVDLRPEVVNREENGVTEVIPAEQAQIGDILLVRPGDRIPLDGVVVEGESRIDTSPVTGEPVPVKVGKGDVLVSGCVNTSGLLKMQVEKVLEDSMVTEFLTLWNMRLRANRKSISSLPDLREFIHRLSWRWHWRRPSFRHLTRKLELLGVHGADLLSHQLPMCACAECAACIFLRNRSRL